MQITTMQEQVDFARMILSKMKQLQKPQKDIHLMECVLTTLEVRLDVENRERK